MKAEKQLLVAEVIDRYPRMVGLLKAARLRLSEERFNCSNGVPDPTCILCQIDALLKEIEGKK